MNWNTRSAMFKKNVHGNHYFNLTMSSYTSNIILVFRSCCSLIFNKFEKNTSIFPFAEKEKMIFEVYIWN